MDKTNKLFDSPEARLSAMLSYNLTQMIYVAARLGIPDLLIDGPKTVDALAVAVDAHPSALYRLLRALAGVGIFAEDRLSNFALTPLAELLRSDVTGSFRPFVLSYGESWWWNAWGSLLHSIQTGETAFNYVHGRSLFEYLDQDAQAAKVFNANMTSMTTGEAQYIVAAYDFSGTRVLVDVGGGHGALTAAILKTYANIRAVLFDLPSLVAGARTWLDTRGIEDRCEVIGGNFFESIPQDGDTYLLKDVLHNWEDDQAVAILKKCHAFMPPSAKLLVIERIIPPGNTPSPGKLIDISMLVMTGGRERTEPEYRALLQMAAFRVQDILPSESGISIIVALPLG
jgi:hypothetical protein